MKLDNIASNMTELTLNSGMVVLFSYKTPVAAWDGDGYIRTSRKWSRTTSKHINKWLKGSKAREVTQEYLDGMVA